MANKYTGQYSAISEVIEKLKKADGAQYQHQRIDRLLAALHLLGIAIAEEYEKS